MNKLFEVCCVYARGECQNRSKQTISKLNRVSHVKIWNAMRKQCLFLRCLLRIEPKNGGARSTRSCMQMSMMPARAPSGGTCAVGSFVGAWDRRKTRHVRSDTDLRVGMNTKYTQDCSNPVGYEYPKHPGIPSPRPQQACTGHT